MTGPVVELDQWPDEFSGYNVGETVSVRFDLSPAAEEGAVRDQLVAMGWTPPGHLETSDRGRPTNRRQKAVELLLAQGYRWHAGEWVAPTPVGGGRNDHQR